MHGRTSVRHDRSARRLQYLAIPAQYPPRAYETQEPYSASPWPRPQEPLQRATWRPMTHPPMCGWYRGPSGARCDGAATTAFSIPPMGHVAATVGSGSATRTRVLLSREGDTASVGDVAVRRRAAKASPASNVECELVTAPLPERHLSARSKCRTGRTRTRGNDRVVGGDNQGAIANGTRSRA
jgi:hypothetical protein